MKRPDAAGRGSGDPGGPGGPGFWTIAGAVFAGVLGALVVFAVFLSVQLSLADPLLRFGR